MVLNISNYNQSFRGVVKVEQVYVDGVKTNDFKVVDSAVKQVKAVLMRQNDTNDTFEQKNLFRKAYNYFDKDYSIPYCKQTGDTRNLMSKARPKGSQDTFIATGDDARDLAFYGVNIGRKRSLERMSDSQNTIGAEENARCDYRGIKDDIAEKFIKSKDHPKIFIYLEKDKKGIFRLSSAKLINDFNKSKKFCIGLIKQTTTEQKDIISDNKNENVNIQKKPLNITKTKNTEVNPNLLELSQKSWDSIEKKVSKRKKKQTEDPNQMLFLF